MFARSEAQNDTSLCVRPASAAEDVREEWDVSNKELINSYVRTPKAADLRSANPLRILTRAVVPIVVSCLAFALLMAAIPTGTDIRLLGGKLLPAAAYPTGTLLARTEALTKSSDHQLLVAGGEKTSLMIWDYAREDGDMVSVLIDGQPMSSSFVITHAPRVIVVPAKSKVQVIGTHDGGGGITYAVSVPDANATIFNGVAAGKSNTYTLRPVVAAGSRGAAR